MLEVVHMTPAASGVAGHSIVSATGKLAAATAVLPVHTSWCCAGVRHHARSFLDRVDVLNQTVQTLARVLRSMMYNMSFKINKIKMWKRAMLTNVNIRHLQITVKYTVLKSSEGVFSLHKFRVLCVSP